MKKVFNNINDVSKLFIAQTQDFAGTPYTYIQGQGKGRRFYFKSDTIYSYRDSYPLARLSENILYIKEDNYSRTTNKHKWSIIKNCIYKTLVYSDDLIKPNTSDKTINILLSKIMSSRINSYIVSYKINLGYILSNIHQPITKSKFPLLFDKKHDKLKQMFFSNDVETFNLAKQIIKQEKLI